MDALVGVRLRINHRRQVGDGESPTCFGSGRRILRPVFGQIGGKLVVSDVLRPILAHVRSKYSNTQHRIRNLEPQTDAHNKFCGALDLNSKPAKTKRSRQIICQGFLEAIGWLCSRPCGLYEGHCIQICSCLRHARAMQECVANGLAHAGIFRRLCAA